MPRAASHPRLLAEAHAFPFATEAAHRLAITALCRDATGVLDGKATSDLAADLEATLRLRSNGMSVELLRQIRDAAWFYPGQSNAPALQAGTGPRLHVPLDERLRALAGHYLERGGSRVRLRGDGDPAELATAWRWLSFFLPADLLVAALSAQQSCEPPDDAVLVVAPRLSETLREPCAETHLHAGAGIPFSLLWAALVHDLAAGPTLKIKRELGAPPFGSGQALTSMLLAAATSRLLLASFLRYRHDTGGPRCFADFCNNHLSDRAAGVQWGSQAAALHGLRAALRHLITARHQTSIEIARARSLYRAFAGLARLRRPRSIEDVLAADPLADWLPAGPGLASPETRFACRVLRHLSGDGKSDQDLAVCFWQYQRVRCLTHRYMVEEPGTAGLDWFTRHYARLSPLRGTLTMLTYASSLRLQARDLDLGALEVRTSPPPSWAAVRDEVRSLAAQAAAYTPLPRRERPETGLVLHFVKEPERSLPAGKKRLHADPRQIVFGCRFGSWFSMQHLRAMAIATALDSHPELLLVLRGADVANVELAVPTWPLVPLFARVRRASVRASERLARLRPDWEAPPLRVTAHAGEDYRRLVEGLRRIQELIETGILQLGDRIGHGIALGEDPARWADAGRCVVQPAEERLDDLLWELERYQRGDLPASAGRVEQVRSEAVRLGRELYRGDVDADDLIAARRLRHSEAALARVNYPFIQPRSSSRRAEQLFFGYLTDPAVFERGQLPIEVHATEPEIIMLEGAQRWLRREIAKRELTVESNPSSNLIIADYLALEDHAVFRMSPLPHMREPDGGALLVSVNTDNPVTFASSLADEMAHLYFALLRRKVPADDALAWLERARDNGYRSRFTLRASVDPEALRDVAPAPRTLGATSKRTGATGRLT